MIGNAVQRGTQVFVYDEKGRQIFVKSAGNPSNGKDGLKGYTSSTVNIRIGSGIFSYNEKGHQTAVTQA